MEKKKLHQLTEAHVSPCCHSRQGPQVSLHIKDTAGSFTGQLTWQSGDRLWCRSTRRQAARFLWEDSGKSWDLLYLISRSFANKTQNSENTWVLGNKLTSAELQDQSLSGPWWQSGTANPLPTSLHSLPGANWVLLLKQEQTQGFNIRHPTQKAWGNYFEVSTLLKRGALPTPLHGRRRDSDKAWRDLLWLGECSLFLPWASCADWERASSRWWGLVHLQQW